MKKIATLVTAAVLAVTLALPAKADSNYITLSSYYVLPEQSITVSGGGFSPGEVVDIAALGTHQGATADGSGRFTSPSFTVPYSMIDSNQSVVATGNKGHTSTATLGIGTFYPNVKPDSYYVPPGGYVQFSGSNFAPGEMIAISGSSASSTTVSADGAGSFSSGWLQVPFSAGDVQFNFTGQTSGVHWPVVIHVSGTAPVIVLNKYYGYSGSGLQVVGSFFGSGESISLTMGGQSVGTTTANSSGSFTANITVPNFPASSVQNIVAVGSSTGKQAMAPFTIAWNNTQVSDVGGAVGQPVFADEFLQNPPNNFQWQAPANQIPLVPGVVTAIYYPDLSSFGSLGPVLEQ